MAVRNPLVIIAGELKELPAGDTLNVTNASIISALGYTPVNPSALGTMSSQNASSVSITGGNASGINITSSIFAGNFSGSLINANSTGGTNSNQTSNNETNANGTFSNVNITSGKANGLNITGSNFSGNLTNVTSIGGTNSNQTTNNEINNNGTLNNASLNGTITINGSVGALGQVLVSQGNTSAVVWGNQTGGGNATTITVANYTLSQFDITGGDSIQAALFRLQSQANADPIAKWNPQGGSIGTPVVDGMPAFTLSGGATTRSVTATTPLGRIRRLSIASGGFGFYQTVATFTTGGGTAGSGGFFSSQIFGTSDSVAQTGVNSFCGVSSSIVAPTNVNPNTLTNCTGVGQMSTDATQLYIFYGGSTAQTPIALGTNFPVASPNTNGDAYRLTLYAPTLLNGVIYYMVERLGTSFVATGTLTPATAGVQTPLNTTLLAFRSWRASTQNTMSIDQGLVTLRTWP